MRKQLTPAEINAYAKNAIIAYCAKDCTIAQGCRKPHTWDKTQILIDLAVSLVGGPLYAFNDWNCLVTDVYKVWDEMLFIAMSETV